MGLNWALRECKLDRAPGFCRPGPYLTAWFKPDQRSSRARKLLTVVTKSNAQRHAIVTWDEIAVEVAREFPDVTCDKMLVDPMTMRMVMRPQSLDTIVATNLHAIRPGGSIGGLSWYRTYGQT